MENTKVFFSNMIIENLVKELYINLPYHNFQHALKAAERGKEIVDNCKKENVPIDEKVVYYALLFHDAGYHENFESKGFKSKEEYSAFLAEKVLKKSGFADNLIFKIKEAIISTHRDGDFTKNEQKVVRAADLISMAESYEEFLDNTKKLKEETEDFEGKKIDWQEWKQRTKKLIEFYLKQDIHLTSAYSDEDGQSIFHKRAKDNLNKFLEEDFNKI